MANSTFSIKPICENQSFGKSSNSNDSSSSTNQNKDAFKKEHFNERGAALYKKPINKNNIKLEIDFEETAQEIRRQQILQLQKKYENIKKEITILIKESNEQAKIVERSVN